MRVTLKKLKNFHFGQTAHGNWKHALVLSVFLWWFIPITLYPITLKAKNTSILPGLPKIEHFWAPVEQWVSSSARYFTCHITDCELWPPRFCAQKCQLFGGQLCTGTFERTCTQRGPFVQYLKFLDSILLPLCTKQLENLILRKVTLVTIFQTSW